MRCVTTYVVFESAKSLFILSLSHTDRNSCSKCTIEMHARIQYTLEYDTKLEHRYDTSEHLLVPYMSLLAELLRRGDQELEHRLPRNILRMRRTCFAPFESNSTRLWMSAIKKFAKTRVSILQRYRDIKIAATQRWDAIH